MSKPPGPALVGSHARANYSPNQLLQDGDDGGRSLETGDDPGDSVGRDTGASWRSGKLLTSRKNQSDGASLGSLTHLD